MSVKIYVKDSSDRPRANYSVSVGWKGGGRSNGQTGSNGVYDTGVNGGTISSVTCYGREMHGYDERVGSDETLSVTYN